MSSINITPNNNYKISMRANNITSNFGDNFTIDASGSSSFLINTNGFSRARFNNLGLVLEPSGNTITTRQGSNLILDASNSNINFRVNGVNEATISSIGLIMNSGSIITTDQSTNLILDASNSNIIFRRNAVQYATMDTSFNFLNAPWCDQSANSGSQIINKTYCDNALAYNMIVNGAMQVDQSFNFTSFTTGNTGGTTSTLPDRWITSISVAGGNAQATIQARNATNQSVKPPTGLPSYYSITKSPNGITDVAGNACFVYQYIEGTNMQSLCWGTSSARQAVLSFFVYASATGILSGSLRNANTTGFTSFYSYPFTYTINSANTWERKSIVVPGPTSTSFIFDVSTNLTTYGLGVFFDFGSGSTLDGSANGTWQAGNFTRANGASKFPMNTANAYLYITGVQLQLQTTGTTAPFVLNPYQTDLALCQRYYLRWGTPVCGSSTVVAACPIIPFAGKAANATPATGGDVVVYFPVPMRIPVTAASQITFTNISFDDQVLSGASITGVNYNGGGGPGGANPRTSTQSASLWVTITGAGVTGLGLYWITASSNGASFLAIDAS